MSDTDFAGNTTTDAAAPAALPLPAPNGATDVPTRPSIIPEKFWDDGNGRVRVEDLAKSYRALERRLGQSAHAREEDAASPPPASQGPEAAPEFAEDEDSPPPAETSDAPSDDATNMAVPASPEEYAAKVSHPWLERDTEIDGFLHSAGFNQEQAQLVYDLAAERVVPVIERMAAEYERRLAQAKLEAHFGGSERFAGIARQVRAWGERHLPKPLYETLAASPDGIAALHHMMKAGEPRLLAGDAPAAGPSQGELESLVRDPRYWRDHDPQLVKRVEEGFRRLYPGE